MKKIVALLCALLMVFTVSAALADVSVTEHLPATASGWFGPLIFEITNPDFESYSWYLERLPKGGDPVGVKVSYFGYLDEMEDIWFPYMQIYWDPKFIGDPTADGNPEPQQLRLLLDDCTEKIYKFYVNRRFDKNLGCYVSYLETATWYPDNTACSFGPNFRTEDPDLTNLWYMFTPIDLSKDGTQEYELVAGNVYVIGKVLVTVAGDNVTVSYKTKFGPFGHIYTKSEYLNFFPDLDSVTTVVPEEIGDSKFAFNQTFSIANDLNGDTNVLMFVRNVVTFRDYVTDYAKLTRFWPNIAWRADLRESMLAMMDQPAAK